MLLKTLLDHKNISGDKIREECTSFFFFYFKGSEFLGLSFRDTLLDFCWNGLFPNLS